MTALWIQTLKERTKKGGVKPPHTKTIAERQGHRDVTWTDNHMFTALISYPLSLCLCVSVAN